MKVAKYNGGMFNSGAGEVLSCCLCGEMDYGKMHVERLGISVGMVGSDYTFCKSCWSGKRLGERLLQLLGYPSGLRLREDSLTIAEIDDAK